MIFIFISVKEVLNNLHLSFQFAHFLIEKNLMIEQEYEISSPLPSPFFAEEYDSDKELEQEEFSPEYLHDDNSTSDIDSEDSEDFEDFEDFEENERDDSKLFEKEEIIDQLENIELTPCVVIDFVKGKIQQCGDSIKLRPLHNLFGTWQVDRDAIKEVDGILSRLGVCDTHFQFDNKYLHKSQNKQLKGYDRGIIQWRRCICCDKYVTYFSRGAGCDIHSWNLNSRNIQIPCNCQYACKVLQTCPPLCKRAFDITKTQCICCLCYEDLGGHIYCRPGRGKKATTCITENSHKEDIKKGLEFLGDWLIDVSRTGHDEMKKDLLIETFKTFLPFVNKLATTPSQTDSTISTAIQITNASTNQKNALNEVPSLFMIKLIFIETSKKNKKNENENNLEIKDFEVIRVSF